MNFLTDLRIAGGIQGILSVFFIIVCQILLQVFPSDLSWQIINYLIPISPLVSMVITLVTVKPLLEKKRINNIAVSVNAKYKKLYENLKIQEKEILTTLASGLSKEAKLIYQNKLQEVVSERDKLRKEERQMLKDLLKINTKD